jgi:predicted ATPase
MEGWGASERAEACERAYELCQQIGSTEQFLRAMFSSADLHRAQGSLQRSLDLGEQMLVLAQRSGDPRHIALAHATLGETCTFRGEFEEAHAHLERALTAGDAEELHALTSLTGPGLDVMCLTWDAWALWALGYPEQGLASVNQGVTAARGIDHPFSLGFALALGGASIHVLRREFEIAREWIEDLTHLRDRCEVPSMRAWFTILQGWKEAMEGQGGRGIARIREGLALWEDMGAVTGRAFQLLLLTEAYRREGQDDEALRVVDEGLALVDSIGERYFEVELHRLRGELLLAQGDNEGQAVACFRQAIQVARRQRARSWELRAAMSLSRVWLRRGRRDEARNLLADVYGWFSEGFDVPDLREARVMLEGDT